MSISGFVQAGGKSRRMGRNKALLRIGSQSLIEHALSSLAPLTSQLGVITNAPEEYVHLGVEIYSDIWPGLGPLAGIGAALSNARCDYSLILACDMPFVSKPILEFLIERGKGRQGCIPRSSDGRLQPLCGLYHRSCFEAIKRLIERDELRLRALADEADILIAPFEDFKEFENAEIFFENVNTPDDLTKAYSLIAASQGLKAEDRTD